MYKVIVKHMTEEQFEDYFTAKARAIHLHLQGYEVDILQDGKFINRFMNVATLPIGKGEKK